MDGRNDVGIAGALLQPLSCIPTPGGSVLHMLRRDSPLLAEAGDFGEIYFSEVLSGHVKAWKCHMRQTQHFAVPVGRLRLVLFDAREDSPTRDVLCEISLGRPDHYALLRIPPLVWYGFTAEGSSQALICNYTDMPHDPEECRHLPVDTPSIPYDWHNLKRNL